jgi:hypothetical protein
LFAPTNVRGVCAGEQNIPDIPEQVGIDIFGKRDNDAVPVNKTVLLGVVIHIGFQLYHLSLSRWRRRYLL